MTARAEARERILRAVVRTLAEEGYGGTTARSIARTGGFAPGVIYYHFEDLEDVLLAALRYTSDARLARYREALGSPANASELLARLRDLYGEDVAEGHIPAVQELIAGSSGSPRMRAGVLAYVEPWADFASEAAVRLTKGTPLEALIPARELGAVAVALFLGIQTLTNLEGNESRAEALFAAAEPLAAMWDALTSDNDGRG